jgi:hypothetical protein
VGLPFIYFDNLLVARALIKFKAGARLQRVFAAEDERPLP